MDSTNEKIGQLIAQIRQERGLTQAEFARRLATSQSAVNRMEHGKQNLSLDILGRISDVLNKQLITLNASAVNLRIEGGHELHGDITLKTSKNAAVALLCASLLNYGVTRFNSFPRIEEVYRIIEVLESIGVQAKWIDNDLEIRRPEKLQLSKMDAAAARKTRSVLMMMGSLMHDHKRFKIPYAGGCKLGVRTVLPHLYALEEFGLKINTTQGFYHCTVKPNKPGDIVMFESGNTPTENAIMAAARVDGVTTIRRAASNYMVRDVCFFLQHLGVKVEGIGSHTITIHGVKSINKDVEFWPSEDPIEAMTFLSIAATTNSHIKINRVPIDYLDLEILKLQKMGMKLDMSKPYPGANGIIRLVDVTVKDASHLVALEDKLEAHDDPGMNMDNLPYFVPVAAAAHGKTLIHDWTYENRAIYYTELTKLNANINLLDVHRVTVEGPTNWKAAEVITPPALRPAVLILIGMLAAPGVSVLRNVYSINRGYEDLAKRLNSLGAKIEVIREI